MSHENQEFYEHHVVICAGLAGKARLGPLPLRYQGENVASNGRSQKSSSERGLGTWSIEQSQSRTARHLVGVRVIHRR